MKLGHAWKSVGSTLANYWISILLSIGAFLAIVTLLGFQLGSLVPGFSQSELSVRAQTSSLNDLKHNPVNLPHAVVQFGYQHFHIHNSWAMRSVSALIGLLSVYLFYYIIQKWYSRRIAILGTLLFATSAWFLHIVRLGTPESLLFGLFLLFGAGVWLEQGKHPRSAALTCGLTVTLLLYIPGMVWFVIPMLVWQQRRLRQAFQQLSLWQLLIGLLFLLLLLTPLVYDLILQPQIYKVLLGFPEQWPKPSQFGHNLLQIPVQLFYKGPADPVRWLGRLPLVDWFGTVMFVVGAYAYRFKLHLDRTWFFVYVFVVGSVLIALGGAVTMSLFVPFLYLIVVGGIALMLQQWFTIFPRNPVARGVALTLMVLAVLSSSFYQLNHYFIAWPHTPETKAVFTQK